MSQLNRPHVYKKGQNAVDSKQPLVVSLSLRPVLTGRYIVMEIARRSHPGGVWWIMADF